MEAVSTGILELTRSHLMRFAETQNALLDFRESAIVFTSVTAI